MWSLKIRRYFRGSGRVLGFVFIASVIWLLFDMAALRLSINDVNSQLLKELIVKEREAVKQQVTKRTAIHRGFKHPVQRVHLDLDNDDQSPVRVVNKVAEVYRKRPRNDPALKESRLVLDQSKDPVLKESRLASDQPKDPVLKESKLVLDQSKDPVLKESKLVLDQPKDPVKLKKVKGAVDSQVQVVHQKWHVPLNTNAPAKKAVDLAVNETETELKKIVITQSLKKVALTVSLNTTRAPSAVQEEKHVSPHETLQELKKDVLPHAKNVSMDSKSIRVESMKEKVPSQTKPKAKDVLHAERQEHQVKDRVIVKPSGKAFQQEDQHTQKIHKDDKQIVETDVETGKKSLSVTEKPKVQLKASDVKVVVERSVHRVQALDLTVAPRDRGAVGQFGHAALVPSDKEQEVRKRWNEGHFNVYLSDQIPLDRAIPDTRPPACSDHMVHDDLPTTSVIFCFVDEVWSTLLRSVHSVLNRSPAGLLKEVILVDDCSTRDYLKEQLDVYMAQFPKVRIIRLKERQGLIRARLAGAAVATGTTPAP